LNVTLPIDIWSSQDETAHINTLCSRVRAYPDYILFIIYVLQCP